MKTVFGLFKVLLELKRTARVKDHSESETYRVIAPVLPYIELSFMSCLVDLVTKHSRSNRDICGCLVSDKWREIGAKSDAFSARLKQNTHMYM